MAYSGPNMIHLFLEKEMGGSDEQNGDSCAIAASLDRAFAKHQPCLASFSSKLSLVTILDIIPLPLCSRQLSSCIWEQKYTPELFTQF